MRNLKKFLALVLAMMMTFSLMVTVNASVSSDFTDADAVTEKFSEGVAVLEGLGVFEGYEDGSFKPKDNITRAEVATIVYRLATGDTSKSQEYLYEGGAKKFKDVPDDHWASGAIGYCANNLLVRGYDEVRFGPNDYVTGVQAITMILRAVGYGQGGEFEGWGWETRAYGRARAEGLLVNVDNTNYQGKLTEVATRELVAELLFQASLIPQVTWTEALGYNKYTTLNGSTQNAYLAWENFKLAVGPWKVIDSWGRPGYEWSYKDGTAATIKGDYTVAYDSTTYECEVAEAMKIKTSQEFKLYVNGKTTVTDKYLVVATDTVTKVGGQGRITEVYGKLTHPWSDRVQGGFDAWDPSIIMIDTFLAKVTKVENEVLDAAGHQMIKAKLHVEMYDGATNSENGGSDLVLEKASGNWEFAKGEFITLNAYTDHANGWDANDKSSAHTGTEANKNEAAFEAEQVLIKTNTTNVVDTYANVTKCEPALGKQTTIYWNQGKHNVDNVDKLDQLDLHLDVAGTTVNTTFAWYYDAKGNLIGIGDAPANSNYGIITSIYSAFKQGEGNTTGEAVAKAHVKYADGNEGDIIIDKFYLNSTDFNTAKGHWEDAANTMTDVTTTNPLSTSATDGAIEVLPIYDNGSTDAMKVSHRVVSSVNHAVNAGWLHVAPVTVVNANSEKANTTATDPWGSTNSYGILKGNLFKFVSSSDGNMTAIEVAGTDSNTANSIYDNHYNATVSMTGAGVDNTAAELSKNYAYLTYIKDGDTPANNKSIRMDNDTKIIVRGAKMDGDNDFTEATDTINFYNGIDELPASIIVPDESEVDWADIDDNGIADVVYVYGVKKGSSGYGLFYYNGGAGQWTGSNTDGSGWLRGWLDAKEADLTFNDKDLFDRVQQSTIKYGGHLFGVKLLDGEVLELLGIGLTTHTNDKDYFLIHDADQKDIYNQTCYWPNATAVAVSGLTGNGTTTNTIWASNKVADGIATLGTGGGNGVLTFSVGDLTVNDYTANTKAVWLRDLPTSNVDTGLSYNADPATPDTPAGYTDIRYNADKNTIEVWDYTVTGGVAATAVKNATEYRLTGTSAKLGDSLQFLNMPGRVNDVTIVFEDGADNAIRQVYVTTRADITAPGGEGTTPAAEVKPGAGVQTLNVDQADLDDVLKALGPNCVIASDVKADDTWANSEADELLYFPFNVKTDGKGATLTIWDKDLNVVYLETVKDADAAGWAAGEGHYFGVNFTKRPDGSTATIHGALEAGTYTYKIVDTTGVELSSGSFGIVAK